MSTASAGGAPTSPAGEVAALLIDVPPATFEVTVAFWAAALSATPEPLPDMPGGDVYVTLLGATAVTDVLLQRIGDDDRPRLHLDVSVADRTAAVARAESYGATVRQREASWDTLVDPAGLPLCVGFEDPEPLQAAPRQGSRGYLDVVSLDVPAPAVDGEVAFWSALLGADPVPPAPDRASRPLRGARAVGGAAIGIEVGSGAGAPDREGPAVSSRLHVALSSTDVDAEADRLRELGARHVATSHDGVTLADPADNLLRVVPETG